MDEGEHGRVINESTEYRIEGGLGPVINDFQIGGGGTRNKYTMRIYEDGTVSMQKNDEPEQWMGYHEEYGKQLADAWERKQKATQRDTQVITAADGSQWLYDMQAGQPIQQMTGPTTDAKAAKYHEYNGNVYMEDPSAANGLRLVIPKTDTADPLDSAYKQAQIDKLRQDMMSPYSLAIQQQYDAINNIQQQIASGQISPQDGEKLMATVRASTAAALQGTTPYQMQTDKQNLARNVLGDRMNTGSSLASSLLSGANAGYGRILAGKGAPLNFDPMLMSQQYVDQMGGGPEMSTLAKAVLMGALGDGQTLPTGASAGSYVAPQMGMPTATTPVAAGVEQYRPMVAKYFPPEAVDNILRIMQMESSGNAAALNPGTAAIPEHSVGLMQINTQAHPQWANENLNDPETNIRLAAELYKASGYEPWYNASSSLGLL